MKHLAAKQPKNNPVPVRAQGERTVDGAFDVWLQRGLHQLYDNVANEPIPDELLRLIEDDRQERKT